jgi:hypothetical protein
MKTEMTKNEANDFVKKINPLFVAVYDDADDTVHEIWMTSHLKEISSGKSWEEALSSLCMKIHLSRGI